MIRASARVSISPLTFFHFYFMNQLTRTRSRTGSFPRENGARMGASRFIPIDSNRRECSSVLTASPLHSWLANRLAHDLQPFVFVAILANYIRSHHDKNARVNLPLRINKL